MVVYFPVFKDYLAPVPTRYIPRRPPTPPRLAPRLAYATTATQTEDTSSAEEEASSDEESEAGGAPPTKRCRPSVSSLYVLSL